LIQLTFTRCVTRLLLQHKRRRPLTQPETHQHGFYSNQRAVDSAASEEPVAYGHAGAALDEHQRRRRRQLFAFEGIGEIGVPFIALYDELEGNAVWAREAEAGDGIHPNAGGCELAVRADGEWECWEGLMALLINVSVSIRIVPSFHVDGDEVRYYSFGDFVDIYYT
jgi:hypothetical protein